MLIGGNRNRESRIAIEMAVDVSASRGGKITGMMRTTSSSAPTPADEVEKTIHSRVSKSLLRQSIPDPQIPIPDALTLSPGAG
jgi:hypothetical protein